MISKKISNQSLQKSQWIYAFLIVIITAITFLPSLQNDFVYSWDDQGYVVENPQIKGLSFQKTKEIFTSHILGNYNPLPIFTFAIEYYFFGTEPFIYHFNNLLLHLMCTLLVFRFIWLLTPSAIVASVVSLLFGIHPLHVESVAWVTERKDVLFGTFYFAAMIAYIHYLKSCKNKYYFLTCAFFLLSLFSKIQAVALPLSLFCIDYFSGRQIRWKAILEKIPLFALSVLFGFLGLYFLKEMKAFYVSTNFDLSDRPFIGAYSLTVYIIKSLIPFKIAAFYPYPEKVNGLLPVTWYASFLILPLLFYFLWKFFRKAKVIFFGLLFFLCNIVFLLQFLEAGGAFLADRFTYVSFTGLFFIYGVYFKKILEKKPSLKVTLYSLAGCFFITLAIISWNRTRVWKDSLTFWNDEIAQYPNVSFSYTNRAGYFILQKMMDKALADYSKYIELRPQNPDGYCKRGIVLLEINQNEKAIDDFSHAIQLNPGYSDAYFYRAKQYVNTGKYDSALEDCAKMLNINPRNAIAFKIRAGIHFSQGHLTEAMEDINRTIAIDSTMDDIYRNRAILHDLLGNPESAVVDLSSHLRHFPGDKEAMKMRDEILKKVGK